MKSNNSVIKHLQMIISNILSLWVKPLPSIPSAFPCGNTFETASICSMTNVALDFTSRSDNLLSINIQVDCLKTQIKAISLNAISRLFLLLYPFLSFIGSPLTKIIRFCLHWLQLSNSSEQASITFWDSIFNVGKANKAYHIYNMILSDDILE